MFCQKCGTEGLEGAFCQKCGHKLSGEEQSQQPTYQQPQYQQPPQYIPVKKTSTGTASLVLGIISLVGVLIPIIGLGTGISGIITGIVQKTRGAEGKAVTGITLSAIAIIFSLFMWMFGALTILEEFYY